MPEKGIHIEGRLAGKPLPRERLRKCKAFVYTALVAAGRAWKMKAFARAVLVAAGLGLAAAAPMLPDATAAPAPSVDPDAAEFTIMGHRFRIPRVYLTQAEDLPGRTIDSWGDAVFMEAALPDLLPITKRDTDYYRWGKGFSDVIDFQIWARPGHAGPNEKYFKEEYLKKCTGQKDGYLVCPHLLDREGSNLFKNEEVLVRVEENRRLAFDCDKDGTQFNEICVIKLPLLDDTELYIRFSRKHFEVADRILARVYDLVCSFLVANPARELIVNHCD